LDTSNTDPKRQDEEYSQLVEDSGAANLNDQIEQKLENAFYREPDADIVLHVVSKITKETDPVDLAHIVSRLPSYARVIVYDNLPDLDAKNLFMINTSSYTRTAIFRRISDNEIKALLEKMPPDEAVSMLDDMSDRRMKSVLDLLDPKKATRIRDLQKHNRNSAGRVMTNEFFSFHLNATVGEVSKAIRENPGIDLTQSVFVYNNNEEMIGYVPGRNLIVNPPYVPLRQIMHPIHHKVSVNTSRDEVVDMVERYKLSALPVVDENNRLVGVISYEDALEAMADIADDTIANIGGTGEDVSEHEPVFRRFLWRAPWLLVTLFAGLVTSTVMIHFEQEEWFRYTALFVTLIAGMSGNVGIQCSTTLVRSLSTGVLSYNHRRPAILKEMSIGALSGVAFGLLCGLVVFVIYHFGVQSTPQDEMRVGITIAAGVFSACVTASALGAFSPFFFARINIDPAVASGPIVTAFNDVLSLQMFFLVARTLHTVLS
jgi:magnesium transporter